jgi:hypothetical protein
LTRLLHRKEAATEAAVVRAEEPRLEEPGLEEPGLEGPGLEEPGLEEPGLEELQAHHVTTETLKRQFEERFAARKRRPSSRK